MEKNISNIRDKRLTGAFDLYRETGNLEPLLGECCVWLIECSARYGAEEDESSEIVVKFLERPMKFIDLFIDGKYPSLPAFLSSVARHMALNERKLRRKGPAEAFIALWQEDKGAPAEAKEVLYHLSGLIQGKIMSLKKEERLILKLRNNIGLDVKDTNDLAGICSKNNVSFPDFIKKDNDRRNSRESKKNELIARMNHYNMRILSYHDISLRESKKQLFKRIDRLNHLYTFTEIGKILGFPPRKVAVIYRRSLNELARNLKNEKQERLIAI